ncbi:hypothetical protein FACS189437_00010 [Bacteroidia bacterium]|nr:hypothetical protein FACS189437_00010 [Bacteroidia bacterium]
MHSLKRIYILSIIFASYFIFILYNRPEELNWLESQAYTIVSVTTIIMSLFGIYIFSRKDIYMFEPIVVIFAMYWGIFVYQPVIDIAKHSTSIVGVDVLSGCLTANLIVIVSFFFLIIGYFSAKKKSDTLSFPTKIIAENTSLPNKKKILKWAYIIWSIGFFFYVFSLSQGRGASWSYILTLGATGGVNDALRSGSRLGALTNFGSCMIASYMYIYLYEHSKLRKALFAILTLIVFIYNGYRFIIVTFILTFIIYKFVRFRKQPSLAFLGVLLTIFLIFASYMEYTRNSLRYGAGIRTEYSIVENITSPFESNFTLYRVFYRFVDVFPEQYSYTYGKTMIWETMYMVVILTS